MRAASSGLRQRSRSRSSRCRCVAIFLRVSPATLAHELERPGRTRRARRHRCETSALAQALVLAARHARPPTCSRRGASAGARAPDARRAAARAPAGRRRDRAARRLRPHRPACIDVASRSRSSPSSLAVAFVAGPFYVRRRSPRSRRSTRRSSRRRARSARGRGADFFRVALPLARGGLGAGAALAFARGLGEFGATIMFAGTLQGVTQTLPLAIYAEFARRLRRRARDGRAARRSSARVLLLARSNG